MFLHPTGGGCDTIGNKERKMAPLSPCNASTRIVNETNGGKKAHHGNTREMMTIKQCLPTDSCRETESCVSMRHLRGNWSLTLDPTAIFLAFTNTLKCDGWVSQNGMRVTACWMELAGRPPCENCAFSNEARPGQIRADSFSWTDRQTDGRSCQTPLAALAQGKSSPCETEVFFCRTVSPVYSQDSSLSHTHNQIHTQI